MAYSQVAIYGMNEKVRVMYKKHLQQLEAPESAFSWNVALSAQAPFRASVVHKHQKPPA